ncbi:protein kinase domain-containing protein [Neorhodopirellula lusitana]|uniref:protein kinase domain-containing protein n=1 Tax=Neorhodopirellula lusitana TaxID=445327 RepID=UPI00384A7FE5
MDPTIAERMTEELAGKTVGGWSVGRYLGSGMTALVFESAKGGKLAALKVFDPDLIKRYGKDEQLQRITRELSLVGKHHANLVQIYDGGECEQTGHLFVAMELIKGENLEDALLKVPREKIPLILSQVTSAARFLEELELAHRDIKPSNIAITDDFDRAVLMDLGVLRPFGDSDLTDQEARVFIGTLRYSSPEFLNRTEDESKEGYRAISIYQLGGVLHDLIMRKPLFSEFSHPYGILVDAVKTERPVIHSSEMSQDIILTARNCLVKDPAARLRLVTWEDFQLQEPANSESMDAVRARVAKRKLAAKLECPTTDVDSESLVSSQTVRQLILTIESVISNVCAGDDAFPRMSISHEAVTPAKIRVQFESSGRHLLEHRLTLYFRCEVVDNSSLSICLDSSTYLLDEKDEPEAIPYGSSVFKGPLATSGLSQQMSNHLYLMLDRAQSVNGMLHSGPNLLDESQEGQT